MRSFLTEARKQGTSRPQGSIAASVEAQLNIMESYWNDKQNETAKVEEECSGIETYQDSGDRQDAAPAPSPLNSGYDAREILDEMHENEIEVTNDNADEIAKKYRGRK